MTNRTWPDALENRLRTLWPTGLSTAALGRQLGVSKNAIVGKAHRLDLPARDSPIKRGGPAAPRHAPRAGRTTLAPLASLERTQGGRTPQPSSHKGPTRAAPQPRPKPALQVPATGPPVAPQVYRRVVDCCWPLGEPGTKGFHFCGVPSDPGRPYCVAHASLAYVRVRQPEELSA